MTIANVFKFRDFRHMFSSGWLLGLLVSVIVVPGAFSAGTAPVHVLVKASELGQGMLIRRTDTCYLLTAAHVMGHSDAAIIVGSTGLRRFGEARLLARFTSQDVALLRVTGAISKECGGEFDEYREDLTAILSARATGSLPFVFDSEQAGAEGGVGRLPIIISDVGPDWLRIATTRSFDVIEQGRSGSLVLVADRPVGILTVVDRDSGEGKVLRIDRTVALIEKFFANPVAVAAEDTRGRPAASAGPESPGNLLSASVGTTVVGWNSLPSSPEFSPSNLIESNRPHSWNAGTKSLPVEVDFRFANGVVQSFGRIEFVLAQDQDLARAAREVEILASTNGATWQSIYSGTLFNNEPVKSVSMAPLRAAYIRIRIYKNWGDPAWVSLRQVRAYRE